jgi:hypothetical protein
MRNPFENLVLVFDTAKAYAERTGKNFWDDLSLVEQRKEIENYMEDHVYDKGGYGL